MFKTRLNFADMKKIIILPEANEMTYIWTMINKKGFIDDHFTLIAEPLDTCFKVHIDGTGDNQIIHVKRIWKDRAGISHSETRDVTIDEFFDKYTILMQNLFKEGYKVAKNNDTVDLLLPFHFMQYIVYTGIHREVEYIEAASRSASNPPKKRNTSPIKTYSLTDCIKIYQRKNKNRKYEYTKKSWPRRGTIRHNANGTISIVRGTTCSPKDKPKEDPGSREYKL